MLLVINRLRRNRLFELVFTVAIAVGLAVCVQAYAIKPYRIPSASMVPTLMEGQRVLVDRISHHLGASPSVGDVVVFRPPASADSQVCANPHEGSGTRSPCGLAVTRQDPRTFIKRVVAVGGDTLAIVDGHAVRNGRRATEPFSAPCGGGPDCNFPKAITIPKGFVFMMGDNRGDSDDSRYWGPVPLSWVIGKAVATYWPPDRVGVL